MEKSKTRKYFKYAFGEIILVVIGILIALQINNWNEEKKVFQYQTKMLHEIRNELIKDTLYFSEIIDKVKNVREEAGQMFRLLGESNVSNDTISKYINILPESYEFTYHKGAYESLKSTGLDKIKNDSIRRLITDMYDFTLPRTEMYIKFLSEQFEKYQKSVDFVDFKFEKEDNRKIMVLKPKPNYLKDQNLIKSTFGLMSTLVKIINRLTKEKEKCKTLLLTLNQELE